MVVTATHVTDWQWQAVNDRMETLGREGYIRNQKQAPSGSTYWTITAKGQDYLRGWERAENASGKANPDEGSPNDLAIPESSTTRPSATRPSATRPSATGQPPAAAAGVVPPVIIKAFGAPSISLRGTISLTFTITNPNSTTKLPNISFNDTLPAGLVVSTPNGLTTGSSSGGGTLTPVCAGPRHQLGECL